jgi:hypothetical protein
MQTYWRHSFLVCIYVGLHIKEFAEDGAEKENATAVSSPCPAHPSTGTYVGGQQIPVTFWGGN